MVFVFPDISSVVCVSKFCFRYSYVVLIIIPLVIFLYFIIKKNFINFIDKGEQASYEREKKDQRFIFLIIRSLIFALVLIAIASPFIMEATIVKGNPRITILVDNSSSLHLFEHDLGKELASTLKNKIPVSVKHIINGDESAIEDVILNH